MDYSEALHRIEALRQFGSQPGLLRVKKLLNLLGNPQDKLSFVHVAGTNGKGSVCSALSCVLSSSGYTTGLFTSPYITCLREQIRVKNAIISEKEFSDLCEYVFSLVDELFSEGVIITEFEFTMALAFEYFYRKGCDVVVLEVGMGGLYDSTNVIEAPLCAVLTPISLDHTGMLGNTLESIACHKCGIIKAGTTVVSSNKVPQVRKVIEDTCFEKSVPVKFCDAKLSVTGRSLDGTKVIYKGEKMCLPLLGEHQVENISLALSVLEELALKGFDRITLNSIREGIEQIKHPARFEVIHKNPLVIIDGAHNPEGMKTFSDTVRSLVPEKKGILLLGMLRDKDVDASLEYIKDLFFEVYTVTINNPRTMTASELESKCRGYFDCVSACESTEGAFDKAFDRAQKNNTHLCVCGSLYLASQIRPYILKVLTQGNFTTTE